MLNQSQQTRLVKDFYESLYEKLEQNHPSWLKEENVPEEMRAGAVDKDGHCKWKLTPTHISQADFQALEAQLGCALPPLVKTFYSTYYNFFCDANSYLALYEGPDNPFEILLEIKSYMDSNYSQLVKARLLPILMPSSCNGDQCFCIDLSNMPDEDACPILYLEGYLDSDMEREEILSSVMEPAWDNFQALLEYCINDLHRK